MNYLAHALTAAHDDEAIIGSLLADWVKGREALGRLTPGIQRGVLIHRFVDQFTDHHPLVREAILGFPRVNRRMATVLVDVVFDHFLAQEWRAFAPGTLEEFDARVGRLVGAHWESIPEIFRPFGQRLRDGSFLTSYGTLEGIGRAFDRVGKRTSRPELWKATVEALPAQEGQLRGAFRLFFPELLAECGQRFAAD
jgi:acyl carrier protein phosphodiesterase